MTDEIVDEGYDDWLDAVEEGEPYYLESPEGYGSLPPRRVCPKTGSTDLEERSMPDRGEIETFTVTYVPTPSFQDDAPYAIAIARFGTVRLTGQVVGIDLEEIEVGLEVVPDVRVSETTGERILVFETV